MFCSVILASKTTHLVLAEVKSGCELLSDKTRTLPRDTALFHAQSIVH